MTRSAPCHSSLSVQLLELLFNETSACRHGGEFGIVASCLSLAEASEWTWDTLPPRQPRMFWGPGGLGTKSRVLWVWGIYYWECVGDRCEPVGLGVVQEHQRELESAGAPP